MTISGIKQWFSKMQPLMEGLQIGGMFNQTMIREEAYRQGRNHFVTAVQQIVQLNLAHLQASRYLKAANITYQSKIISLTCFAIPIGTACLAHYRVRVLGIGKAVELAQDHIGKLSLLAIAASSVGLYILGQKVIAVTTLVYLSIGVLDRRNYLPEIAHKVILNADFIFGQLVGLYLGTALVRIFSTLNLVMGAVGQYFKFKQRRIENAAEKVQINPQPEIVKVAPGEEGKNDLIAEDIPVVEKTNLSWNDFLLLRNGSHCPVKREHVQRNIFPVIKEDVKVDRLIEMGDKINWDKHLPVLMAHLNHDERWVEVGQHTSTPIDYFNRSLRNLVVSIRDRQVMQGKPQNYEALERYTRFIAQEIDTKDENSQVDILIVLGVEGGEYCGPGKFRVIEEMYGNLTAQAAGLPLDLRVLICLQQERQRLWYNIYKCFWKTNPTLNLLGYLTNINDTHNYHTLTKLSDAGKNFGILHEAAENDPTVEIQPTLNYIATVLKNSIKENFWEGKPLPQFSFTPNTNLRLRDKWKVWKWYDGTVKMANIQPYDQRTILESLNRAIGTPQIPKADIYEWWASWINRQQNLSEGKKAELNEELIMQITINNEPFEIDGQIQPKFLKGMLIEMGILEKGRNLPFNFKNENLL